jgi:hypothetical protein
VTLAETIYQHSLNLSEPAAREALDFIRFLESRHGMADETKRAAALTKLAAIRLHFDGKPISNRDELYDGARD